MVLAAASTPTVAAAVPTPAPAPAAEAVVARRLVVDAEQLVLADDATVRAAASGIAVTYHGGPVISHVRVIQVLYGAGTYTPEVEGTGPGSLAGFYAAVTDSTYLDWLAEYGTPTQPIGRGSFLGQFRITPSAANAPVPNTDPATQACAGSRTVSSASIKAELQAQAAAGQLPANTADTYYAVHLPASVGVTSNGASSGCAFCALHGTTPTLDLFFGVLPDFTTGGMPFGCGAGTRTANEMEVASHELVEAITDPAVSLARAWYDPTNGEIADICNDRTQLIVGGDGASYTVQAAFSVVQDACVFASPPLLRVVTEPPVPSQVVVDGIARDTWGLTWLKVAPGAHTVCFRDVPGFGTPPCRDVTATAGATTVVSGAVARRGTIRVTTSPAVASSILIDDVVRDDWGVWTELPPGVHRVCFGPVAGFAPPPCQDATVIAGELTAVTGSFVADPTAKGVAGAVGGLHVTTTPAVPSQILVDGIVRDTWGAWFTIAAGPHVVCFTDVEGFTTPGCRTVDVTAGATVQVTSAFAARGFLRVVTEPAVPATVSVDGTPRDDWGMWTDLEPGVHTVCFGAVPSRRAPSCQQAVVTAGSGTTVTGAYG